MNHLAENEQNPFERLSTAELRTLLRVTANRLEMLLRPDEHHHVDDAERLRIQSLRTDQRFALRVECDETIKAVRSELLRRTLLR